MAKKDRKLMQELLSKALEPPRKPMSKERLDNLLEDYDDGYPLSKTIRYCCRNQAASLANREIRVLARGTSLRKLTVRRILIPEARASSCK